MFFHRETIKVLQRKLSSEYLPDEGYAGIILVKKSQDVKKYSGGDGFIFKIQ
jgi:hypothetical protein